MPASPTPMPTPAPGVPTGNPGYINSSTSGVLPQTGTSACDFSGPWFIETQTMSIHYIRIPSMNDQEPTITLSGVPSVDYNIQNTSLAAKATCTVTKQKVEYECYDTSSWQQSQKFAFVAASADHNGSSYGLAADFTASSLGPQGSIVTYQPYYHRRPWLSSDTTMASSVEVYNTSLTTEDCNGCSSNNIVDIFWDTPVNKFKFGGPRPGNNASFLATWHYHAQNIFNFRIEQPKYYIQGQYNYNKESFYQTTDFVDQFGQQVETESMYPAVPDLHTTWNCQAVENYGLPEYKWTRHDWS
tara:strand:+ start:15 stop:914 length:900 start_codon:yes stop_codon:yes gene_type:complete